MNQVVQELRNGYPMGIGTKADVKTEIDPHFRTTIREKLMYNMPMNRNGSINISAINPAHTKMIEGAKKYNKKFYKDFHAGKIVQATRKVVQIVEDYYGITKEILTVDNSAITFNRSMRREKEAIKRYFIKSIYHNKDGSFNEYFYEYFKDVLSIINQNTNLVKMAEKGGLVWNNIAAESALYNKGKKFYHTESQISLSDLLEFTEEALHLDYKCKGLLPSKKVIENKMRKFTIVLKAVMNWANKTRTERFSLRHGEVQKEIHKIGLEEGFIPNHDGSNLDSDVQIDEHWSPGTVKRLLAELNRLGILKLIQRQKGPNTFYEQGLPSFYAVNQFCQTLIEHRSIGFKPKTINGNRSMENFDITEVEENVESFTKKFEGFFKATSLWHTHQDLIKELLVIISEQQFIYKKQLQIFNAHQYTMKQFKEFTKHLLVPYNEVVYLQFEVEHLNSADNSVEQRKKKKIYEYDYTKNLPVLF